MNRAEEDGVASIVGGCGCWIAVMIFNLALGGITFSYDIWVLFGKTAPWWVDAIVGLFTAEITVPVAVILWVLQIHGPLFK